jgi:hypothetical protein
MSKYVYFSVLPEALIASMLAPADFGAYMATGTKKRTRGQSIFFEVDQEVAKSILPWEYINRRCVPNEEGLPKSSVYLSIYKVLEVLPIKALKSLYLTTEDGKVLELTQSLYDAKNEKQDLLHLYQELCPVSPLVASNLSPFNFLKRMTSNEEQVQIPKLMFVELNLGELAADPVHGSMEYLPYPNLGHLRDCLLILKNEKNKDKKTVNRTFNGTILYRTCQNGLFVGSFEEYVYYKYPSLSEIEEKNYDFWRSI